MCVREHSFLLQYVPEFLMFEMLHFGGNSLIQTPVCTRMFWFSFSEPSWLFKDEKSVSGV